MEEVVDSLSPLAQEPEVGTRLDTVGNKWHEGCGTAHPRTLDIAKMKGCEHGTTLYRTCQTCGEVEAVVFPCNSRFKAMCAPCSRRWRHRNRARFMRGITRMTAPKMVTLTLRKPCEVVRLKDIWVLRKMFFWALSRRGYAIRSWCGAVELPNHLHLVVDMDYVPKHEMKEIWHGLTGDSFILDVRALYGGRDGYEGASRYITKYITKASDLNLEDMGGFHLVGSWGLSADGSWAPVPHPCLCGGAFGAPFGMRDEDEEAFLLGPRKPPPRNEGGNVLVGVAS